MSAKPADDWSPDEGDLVWIDFSPTIGTEQAGRRPALVLSPRSFNSSSGRAVVLPVTSTVRNLAFEVRLPTDQPISGAALADQVRSVDWRARFAKPGGAVPEPVLMEARIKVAAIIALY